jgi:WD40 repeat protein
MNLAGQALESPLGLARVADLLSHWTGEPDLRGWEWYYLHGLCHQDLLTIPVSVMSVAWSPDGKRLATQSYSAPGPKVWDAVTGKPGVVLAGGNVNITLRSVAWSPDGTLLGNTTIWDAVTGKRRLRLDFQERGEVTSVAWAPGGSLWPRRAMTKALPHP